MKLQQYRQARGWTQSKLSRLSGVSQTYISELEAGKKQPTVTIAHKLAEALGVGLDDLLGVKRRKGWSDCDRPCRDRATPDS